LELGYNKEVSDEQSKLTKTSGEKVQGNDLIMMTSAMRNQSWLSSEEKVQRNSLIMMTSTMLIAIVERLSVGSSGNARSAFSPLEIDL
jgi:hypothetical protein